MLLLSVKEKKDDYLLGSIITYFEETFWEFLILSSYLKKRKVASDVIQKVRQRLSMFWKLTVVHVNKYFNFFNILHRWEC